MLLRLESLGVAAAGRQLVRDVSLDLAAGTTLAVVGTSGSGKTTLARAVLGLPPAGFAVSGRAPWNGDRNLLELSATARRRWRAASVGWIPQEPAAALNPRLRAGQHLAEVLRRSGETARGGVAELLREVGLAPERARDFPHQWSGGMQQRLLIAMAWARHPALLIADESTSALDAETQAQVLDLLLRLQAASGAAILLITHDLAVAARCAGRVAVLEQGCVAEIAAVPQLLAAPTSAAAQALLAAQPAWSATV